MSKKPYVDVDEDMLRDAMLGVPAMRNRQATEAIPSQGEAVQVKPVERTEPTESEPVPEPTKRGPYRKKRREEEQTYRDLYLVNDGVCSRVSTYINRDTHETIKRFLSSAAPEISIVSYINNILSRHLDEHQEMIEELYRTGIDKPLMS
jgi:hypothetical protein